MQPMLAEFEEIAAGIALAEAVIPIVSNVTGEVACLTLWPGCQYWYREHSADACGSTRLCAVLESAGVSGIHANPVPTLR